MVIKYLISFLFPTPAQREETKREKEERDKQRRLEDEIAALYRISSRARGNKGEFHHRQNSNLDTYKAEEYPLD